MALPQTIGTSLEVSNNGYAGPFRASNGDHYVVLQVTTNKDVVAVYKADNGDNTWAEQDSAGRPITAVVSDRQGLCATLSGTVIHVATWGSSGSNRYVHYHAFDTSSDTWTTTEEAVAGPFTSNTGFGTVSIEVRSDGDKIIFYQGPYENISASNYDRIYYAVHQGTGWTDASGFLNTGETKQYRFVYTVMGASDKVHVFYSDESALEVVHVSFNSSNTLSSIETVTTTSSANPLSRPFYFDDGGNETITVGVMQGTTAYRYTVVNDGTPGGGEAVSDVAVHQDFSGAHRSFGMVANPSTGIEYLAYVDSTTQDLWYDVRDGGTWGTDTEVLDAITGKRLCVNVYTIDNGDTVLAYVYNDNATIKYHETVIAVAASGVSLAGAGSIGITATANLSIDTPLSASANIGIDSTAALGVDTPLSASALLAFTGTAGLGIDTPLSASGSIALTSAGALSIDTPLSASAAIGIDATAALGIDTPLAAAASIDIVSTANLSAGGEVSLAASALLSFVGTAGLSLDTPLSASGALGIDASAALSIDTPLNASAALSFTATANLTVAGTLSVDDDRLIILTPRRRLLRPDVLLREMELTPRRRVIRVED